MFDADDCYVLRHPGNLLATPEGDLAYLDFGESFPGPRCSSWLCGFVHITNPPSKDQSAFKIRPEFSVPVSMTQQHCTVVTGSVAQARMVRAVLAGMGSRSSHFSGLRTPGSPSPSSSPGLGDPVLSGSNCWVPAGMMSEAPKSARYAIMTHIVHLVNRDYL